MQSLPPRKWSYLFGIALKLVASFIFAFLLTACQEQLPTAITPSTASTTPLNNNLPSATSNPPTPSVTLSPLTTSATVLSSATPTESAPFILMKTYSASTTPNPKDRAIINLIFNPAGKDFAATTADCVTTINMVTDGKKLASYNAPAHSCLFGVDAVAFSPNGEQLAIAGDGFFDIRVINLATGAEMRLDKGLTATVSKIIFSPDGKFLAAHSSISANIYATALWDAQNGKLVARLKASLAADMSFTSDSRALITSSGQLTFWETATGKLLFETANNEVLRQLAISSDGKLLVGSNADGAIIWDVASRQPLLSLKSSIGKIGNPTKTLGTLLPQLVTFSASNNYLLKLEANQTITGWNLTERKEIFSYKWKRAGLTALAIAPDKKHLLAGYSDGAVELWEVLI